MNEMIKTYCRLCEAQCGLIAEVDDQQIVKIHPDREHPISTGHLCVKAAGMATITYDPDRVVYPLKKVGGSGEFEQVTWDEALDDIAGRLAGIRDRFGSEAIGHFLGNPASFASLHGTYAALFMRILGATKSFNSLHIDTGAKNLALELVYGNPMRFTFPDLEHCDFLIIMGGNPLVSHMSLIAEPRILQRLKAIHGRGGVVVIDPRRTETAERFEHMPVRPDSDVWLLAAMLNHIFTRELYDPSVIDRCAGWDELKAAVAAVTPELASLHCGLEANDIVALAERFAGARTAACYGRVGTNRGRFSTLTNLLIESLNVVTGRFGKQGGWVIGISPTAGKQKKSRAGYPAYGLERSRIGDIPQILGFAPGGSLADEITTPGPGQVRALFVDCANPVRSYPDGESLSEALQQLDLLVALDLYVTETSRHADYILPATTFYERPDLTDFWVTNAPRPWIQQTDAVIEPRGEARVEFDIYNDILRRLGLPTIFSKKDQPAPSLMEMLDGMLRMGRYGDQFGGNADGLSIERLKREFPSGVQIEGPAPEWSWECVDFDDGRTRLWCDLRDREMKRLLREQPGEREDQFRLFGRRKLGALNSWMHNVEKLTKSDHPTLLIHPDDAGRLNIDDGQMVAVASAHGSIEVEAQISDEVIQGSVNYPHGYGHCGGWQLANELPGADVNQLASARPEDWEQVSGMVHVDGIEVTLSPIPVQ